MSITGIIRFSLVTGLRIKVNNLIFICVGQNFILRILIIVVIIIIIILIIAARAGSSLQLAVLLLQQFGDVRPSTRTGKQFLQSTTITANRKTLAVLSKDALDFNFHNFQNPT